MSGSHIAYTGEIKRQFLQFQCNLEGMIQGIVKKSFDQNPTIKRLEDIVSDLEERNKVIEKQEQLVSHKEEMVKSRRQYMKRGREEIAEYERKKPRKAPAVIDLDAEDEEQDEEQDVDSLDLSIEF